MDPRLRRACLLGAIPLCTGLAILLTWMATRWEFLIGAGLLTIALGVVAVLLGTAQVWAARGAPFGARVALMALLWGNFPAAGFAVMAAEDVMTSFTVSVRNASGALLQDLEVRGPGDRARLGTLAPGGSALCRIRPTGDGLLLVDWNRAGESGFAEPEVYVSGGLEGHIDIEIRAEGLPVVHYTPRALGWFQRVAYDA